MIAFTRFGREIVVGYRDKVGLTKPAFDLRSRKTEAAMGLFATQEFMGMRRKINNQQASTGPQPERCLAQDARRIVQKMQHLMQHDEIEPFHLEGQCIDIALAQLGAHLRFGKARPRNREHGMAGIDTDEALRPFRQKLQHAPCTGAEIQHCTKRCIPDRLQDGGFDDIVSHMQ